MKQFKYLFALVIVWMGGMINVNADVDDTFLASATLVAPNGTSQDIDMRFTVNTDQEGNRTVRVGQYYYASINSASEGKVIIPSSVVSPDNEFEYTVTKLANKSFLNCSKITEVVIPENVTIVGDNAFEGCSALRRVEFPSSVTTLGRNLFWNCKSLTYTNFPSGVTNIPESAFMGCSALTSIVIPNTITSIDQWAFRDCTHLTNLTIPESVSSIGTWAFASCTSLTDMTIPNVTNLGTGVFGECTSLETVSISGNVTTISGGMFEGCTALTSVTLPETVTTIEYEVFLGCTALQSIVIPEAVTKIGEKAFSGSGLISVTIPAGVTRLDKYIFQDCKNLTCVSIPNSLKSIMDYAFEGCSALETINIPSSLTSIGTCAFNNCSALSSSIVIPETITEISFDAFRNCSSLTSVTIPSGIARIYRPFQGCSSLQDVYFSPDYKTTAFTSYSTTYPLFGASAPENVKIHVSPILYQAFQQKLTSWYFYEAQSSATDPCEKLVVDGGAVKVGDEGLAKIVCKDLTTGAEKNVYAVHLVFTKVDGERTAIIYRPKVDTSFESTDDINMNNCWKDGRTAIERITSSYTSNMSLTLPSHVEDYEGNVYTVIGIGAYAASTAGDAAFSGYGVEEIRIPKTYTHIGRYALRNFNNLKGKVVIPSSVKQLGHPSTTSFAGIFSSDLDSQYGRVTALYFLHRNADDIAWYDGPSGDNGYFLYKNNYSNIVYLYTCKAIKDNFASTSGNGFYAWDQKSFHRVDYFYPEYSAAIGGSLKAYAPGIYEITVSNNFDLPLKKEYFSSSDEEIAAITDFTVTESGGIKNYKLKLSVSDKGGEAIITFNYPGDDVFDAMTSSATVTRVPGTFIAQVDGRDIVFKILTEDANGGTVQIGERDYDNTDPIGDEAIPCIFEKGYSPTSFSVPESVEYNGKTFTVTAIGAYALSTFDGDEIELPATITNIGYHAFNYSCWVENLYVNSQTPPTLVIGGAGDEDPSPFDGSLAENCLLYVPEGCEDEYSGWSSYFKHISGPAKKVVINGTEYKEEADLFGDGTAVLTWEYEGAGGDDVIKLPSKVKTRSDDGRVPVLTLNGANITSTEGPAIEVNTYPRFYIRVQSGENSISAANASAAISIGTNNGMDMTSTSLIILNDDGMDGGGVSPKAPTRSTQNASLSITNTTSSGEDLSGVYVYQGSFNVLNCGVNIFAPDYGLVFSGDGGGVSPNAPSRSREDNGPKKVVSLDGPIDNACWLNLYEGSALTLNGGTAALWGASGYSENDDTFIPGYLQDIGLVDSDKSTYESNPNYSVVEGPLFFPAGLGDFNGSYYFGCLKGENDYDVFSAKYLKFASNVFVSTTDEGISMKFMITGENTVQVGNEQGNSIVSVPDSWNGQLTIPATITDGSGKVYQVKGLADKALYQRNDLSAVTISEGIEYIGTGLADWGAFEEDYNLQTVYLPSSTKSLANWCFNNCTSIQEVYLFSTVVPTLGNNPFSCSNATLYVPVGYVETYQNSDWSNYFNTIEEMPELPVIFKATTVEGVQVTFKVTSVEEGNYTVQTYGYYVEGKDDYVVVPAINPSYAGDITIPEKVTYEGIEYTVTAIGEFSFAECAITSVTIPTTVTAIGDYAFAASPLMSVTVLNSDPDATVLSENPPFVAIPSNCKLFVPEEALTAYQQDEVWPTIFVAIRAIGDNSIGVGDIFTTENGEGVQMTFQITGTTPNTVQTYGYWNDDDYYAVTAIPRDYQGSITIPETVTYNGVTYTVTAIGDESFDADGSPDLQLTNVTIPSTITYIGEYAFYGCSLTSVTIPNSVTSIGYYAFGGCTSLETLTLGSGIKSLSSGVFNYCLSLASVYANMKTPPSLPVDSWTEGGETQYAYVFDVLQEGQTRILYVPARCADAYQDSDWWSQGGFSEIVEMEGGTQVGDFNGDDDVDQEDVTLLTNFILGNSGIVDNSAADINGDGDVNIADVTALINIILGKNTPPIGNE